MKTRPFIPYYPPRYRPVRLKTSAASPSPTALPLHALRAPSCVGRVDTNGRQVRGALSSLSPTAVARKTGPGIGISGSSSSPLLCLSLAVFVQQVSMIPDSPSRLDVGVVWLPPLPPSNSPQVRRKLSAASVCSVEVRALKNVPHWLKSFPSFPTGGPATCNAATSREGADLVVIFWIIWDVFGVCAQRPKFEGKSTYMAFLHHRRGNKRQGFLERGIRKK